MLQFVTAEYLIICSKAKRQLFSVLNGLGIFFLIIWTFQVTKQIALNPGLAATGKKKITYCTFTVTKHYIVPEIKW